MLPMRRAKLQRVVYEYVARPEMGEELGHKRMGVDREMRSWVLSQLHQGS